jgi:hypothetical protein
MSFSSMKREHTNSSSYKQYGYEKMGPIRVDDDT